MVTSNYAEGLIKQVFVEDVMFNGWWLSKSPLVNSVRGTKRPWEYSNKFEYRMLLATAGTGGSLPGSVFNENVSLLNPGSPDWGVFKATYGSVFDGMSIDMMRTLETENKRAAFNNDAGLRLHQLRRSVSSLFKNFCIHGQFGVVHQLRSEIAAPTGINAARNPMPNVGFTPNPGDIFTIAVPSNVTNTDFKKDRLLIKTKEVHPAGMADVTELYRVLNNQPYLMTLQAVGTTCSAWEAGEFLEVFANRQPIPANAVRTGTWAQATNSAGETYMQWQGTGTYSAGKNARVGAMEGYADMFPWYTDPADIETRLMLDYPYRDQPNRLEYTFETAGGYVAQMANENIIDAIMRGCSYTNMAIPDKNDVGIVMNPDTLLAIGRQEGNNNFRQIKDLTVAQPYIYQRGIKEAVWQIGSRVFNGVMEEANLPTDVVIIQPRGDMSYNCWDNAMAQIDAYIRDTYSPDSPPTPQNLDIGAVNDLASKLDITNRIIIGQPTMNDGDIADGITYGNRIIHPRNEISVALQESGALFTEYPYTYTIVKLREPIGNGGVLFSEMP
ncbi:MAG: hypothetical protein Pg6A_20050 [Termitinemataceae bacterium]|nr:MAG: hypothetical protein Pg6A_20050 [Termitinemataceae bacterium]